MKNLNLLLILIFCSNFGLSAQTTQNPAFKQKIEETITHSIPIITAEQLQKKLNIPNLVLLDAREPNEYKVSHLPNALQVGYDNFNLKKIAPIDKNAIVVIYCSIGYRSEKIGEQLKKKGYSKVYNLYGGIFEWVNTGYQVVDNKEQSTKKVHTYNKEWSKWLENGTKIY